MTVVLSWLDPLVESPHFQEREVDHRWLIDALKAKLKGHFSLCRCRATDMAEISDLRWEVKGKL
jgi:hypothetical protein